MSAERDVCPTCGAIARVHVSQAVSSHGPMWSRSIACSACGLAIEEDSGGDPPSWVKAILIERYGLWTVVLTSESDRLRAVAVLRSLVGFDMKTAAAMLRGRGSPLREGTRAECSWLQQQLTREDIAASVISASTRTDAGDSIESK